MAEGTTAAVVRHAVSCAEQLEAVVSKAPGACLLIPELADEDSPEGWQVMGGSRTRVRATVRQFLEHALYDLTYGIPDEYRHLPAVEEQRELLRGLLEGRSFPFHVELRQAEGEAHCGEDLEPSEVLPPGDGGSCRPIDQQLGLNEAFEAPDDKPRIVALGDPEALRRCVVVAAAEDEAWREQLAEELRRVRIFADVLCRDSVDAAEVGPDALLLARAAPAAAAALRLAAEASPPLGALALVGADGAAVEAALLDDGAEVAASAAASSAATNVAASRWEAVRRHTGWILQLHPRDDPAAGALQAAEALAQRLGSELVVLDSCGGGPSGPSSALLQALIAKLQ